MKTKPVIIIAVILVIGFVVGYLTSSMISHQRMKKFRSFRSVEAFKEGTIRLIEPSEEQMKNILPLIDEYAKKINQQRKEFGREFFNMMMEFHTKIKPFLTEEQILKLESLQRPPPRFRGDSAGRGDTRFRGDTSGRDLRFRGDSTGWDRRFRSDSAGRESRHRYDSGNQDRR